MADAERRADGGPGRTDADPRPRCVCRPLRLRRAVAFRHAGRVRLLDADRPTWPRVTRRPCSGTERGTGRATGTRTRTRAARTRIHDARIHDTRIHDTRTRADRADTGRRWRGRARDGLTPSRRPDLGGRT
ncbi:hypothetical protein Cme02nite_47710 [Catellatospora methionotrophica]|uniref:Uncharacterized protein n=1 Tax=Catellatospora methionotrophica TaxID=121620 RepID=A0A8J3LDA1_9ACTN|nr:hypothetical protein Cme02nite_47710 [Catellatospora methionotrophica]